MAKEFTLSEVLAAPKQPKAAKEYTLDEVFGTKPAPVEQADLGMPMGDDMGSAIMAAAEPKKQSVLEGIDLPEPTFDPAEANRLSRRGYAEEQAQKFDPRYRQKVTQGGPRKPPSAAELSGGMMQDANPLLRIGAKTAQSSAEGLGGLLRIIGDVTGSDTLAGTGEYMGKNAQEYQQAMGPAITGDIQGFGPKSVVPDVLKYTAEMGEGAASSLAQSIAASALGPTAVIPMLSVMSAGSQYNKARDAGQSTLDSLTNAVPYGVFEAVGEKFAGLDKAAAALKSLSTKGASDEVKKQAGDTLLKMGIKEIPGELITYLGQTGVDLLPGIGLNPNLTMAEFLNGMRDTVVQAGMMGGATAGVGKYLQSRAPQGESKIPSAEQMMRDRGFLIPEPKPEIPSTLVTPPAGRIEPTFEPEALETIAPPKEPSLEVTDLTKQRAKEQKNVLDLEQELEAPKETAPVTPEAAPPAAAKAEEDYANKSFEELQALRESADQTNDALDLAAVQKHFGPEVAATYEQMSRRQRNKWWDENATEALDRDASTFNGINEELLDEYIKAHNDFDTESPRALGRSVGLLVRDINNPGFVGSPDFVRLKNALAYAKQQGWSEKEVLDGMRERASAWAGADAQELFKDLFKAKPVKTKAAELAPAVEEETIPFFGEDLTGKPMPDRPEVQELLTQAEEASKAAEQLSKRTAGTSLFKVLQGSLANSEMSELGGRSRQVGKNPFMSLVAKKGKPGSSMEDMVNSGALDLFLPENMRPGNPMYDNGESAAYIREKLIQGQYYTYDTEIEIRRVTEGIWDLDKLINEELSIDDINKEIELAFDEQREADLAVAEIVPEGEARSAEQRKAAPTNDELDKREAQLEREAQLNKREARLLEERKRLEEERLKLEGPTEEEVVQEEERKSKAAELDEREQIRKESEAGADQFELTREEGRQDTTGNLFEQPEPETVEVSPEQERKEALANLKITLTIATPPFRAVGAKKTQILRPAPLTNLQIEEILQLASDAMELGLPAAVLGNVKNAGSTRMKAGGVMSEQGSLMIGSQWKGLSSAEKLHTLIHELGHAVDFKGGTISYTANWSKAETELKNWYTGAANKFTHPFRYPYAPQYKGSVDYEMESFAEAFAAYFTSPVDLQKNAPEAYSQIQAIVERIQDGSQKAREAGTTERGTAGIKIQPSRPDKGTAVQPNAGAQRTGISGTTGLKNRRAETLKTEKVNPSAGRTIFSQRPLVNWTEPEMTDKDKFIYYVQNRHIDTKRVIDEIAKSIGAIEDTWNPYLMEELFHGRAAKQTKDFLVNELRPLLKEMDLLGVTIPELEEYLHNKHAEERNVQVAKVNPTLPDEGSGITTAAARAYLANLSADQKAKLEQADKMVKIITSNTRQMLVDSGLESQETLDAWEKTYGDYVPLNREDVDYSSQQGKSVGQGYSVRGSSSKRSIGSTRKVVDILANIAMQRERTIVRAEKNRVATALYGLALKNPNPGFWLAVNPDSKKDMQATINELVNMGLTARDALSLMKEPTQKIIDPKTGLVTERINPVLRGADNVMAMRVNGKDRFIFFNQNNKRAERMVTALKNLDADQLGFILSNSAKVTRFFASINTQYNPVFGIYNFLRDSEGAILQLSTTELAGKQKEVMMQVMPAVRGIYAQLRADHQGKVATGQWSKLWEEFQQQGGQTGFRDQFSRSEERGQALERELKKMSQGKASDAKDAVLNWLSDYNETMENAVRLAAYKTGLDNGLSQAKSASLAKNLTVNFNRKGQIATQANALYAFFNSAVQGTTRLGQTLAGPAGKTIIGGGLLAGVVQAVGLSMAGFGDDDPPDFIKDKSFIIPLMNGKYIAFPMPLGYNVIPSTARIITEGIMAAIDGRRVDASKRVQHLLGLYMDSFNPIGNAGWSMQTFTPTPVDWLAALLENKDWTGKPIAKEDFNKLNPTPGYLRAKEAATIFGKSISKFLNYASGGSKYEGGLIDVTPDQIDYLIGQATGGLGREIMKAEKTARALITGEDLPPHNIPLAGRFYGDVKGSSSVANHFYDNIKKMNIYEQRIKGMRKDHENVQELYKTDPEARAYKRANETERDVQKLRKLRHNQVEKGAAKEVVKATEEKITRKMQNLNDHIATLEGRRKAQKAEEE